ncbi:MAG: beta-N-acetylhexosaminidase [Planctomycetota bacterium]|jgi:hexosaminidase
MAKKIGTILIFIIIASAQICGAEIKAAAIIPQPMKIEVGEGTFDLTPETIIVVTEGTRGIGEYLAGLLGPATGFKLEVKEISQSKAGANCIYLLDTSAKARLGAEGYDLKVLKNSIFINAASPAGVFYGCQTLRQLLPRAIESKEKVAGVGWNIEQVEIEDKPRYVWRGMHLDVSRYFFEKEFVKKYIDLLAYHKFNVLHMHLTDDQGWRIEIKKHPKLTEIGAWREGKDGERYGGFYTQKGIAEIIEYAAGRFVTIVPEVEMPGHSVAALAAYPELSCTGGPFKVETKWGIHKDVFCAGNDATFELLQDVLGEVADLFSSEYIHIGGDECPKDRWKACSKCQARIKAEGLKDEHELQSYFIKRISKFLTAKNKKLIGWDEILEGGLAKNAAVMSWRGTKGGIAAARAGHDVVMSPSTHCYFDMKQSDSPDALGATWAKPILLEKVYSYEPTPSEITAEQSKHILGAQGNVWTEHIPTEKDVEYMAVPRMCALAEVVWSPKELRDWADFKRRLKIHCERLDKLGVNYYRDW